jgi:hypothetical protein
MIGQFIALYDPVVVTQLQVILIQSVSHKQYFVFLFLKLYK